MRKQLFSIGIALTVLALPLWAANGNLGRGTDPLTDGSEAHPWRIQDLADFQQFCSNAMYWSGFTRLECDLDLSATVYDRAPIATNLSWGWDFSGTQFSGHFDGNHHTIGHLQISSSGSFIGLFGSVSQTATVTDLHMADVQITGLAYVGSLCGASDGQIINCSASGSLTGSQYIMQSGRIGGLLGMNSPNGIIDGCYSEANVTAPNNIGGLCGINYGLINRSSSSGTMTAADCAGGLCAANQGTIRRCFSQAHASSDFVAGGLCGQNSGLITDCYAAGTVTGGAHIGGLCGWNNYNTIEDGVINNCYSTASTPNHIKAGGFCGRNDSSTAGLANFWNTETSGTETGIGTIIKDTLEVAGKTTAQMQMLSTFTAAGWDFSETDGDEAVWMMLREGEDFPRLAWQEVIAGDVAGLYGVNLADVAYLSGYWQTADCGVNDCGRADIDGSGEVDIDDLLAVADHWLKGV